MHPKVIPLGVGIRQMNLANPNDFAGNGAIGQYSPSKIYPVLPLTTGDDVINRGERHG
jgi:hypothetical protein